AGGSSSKTSVVPGTFQEEAGSRAAPVTSFSLDEDDDIVDMAGGSSTSKAGVVPGSFKEEAGLRFSLDEDDDIVDMDAVHADFAQDCRLPEVPPPPEDFSAEDLQLREVLSEFYLRHRAENLANINYIVVKYRGRNVANLWAQLTIKYGLPATEGVDLLSRTLYQSAPFEYVSDEKAALLTEALAELQQSSTDLRREDRPELFRRVILRGAQDGSDGLLRMLSFRGIPDDRSLRCQVWKVLLGYLPMKRHDEWSAIQGEKRALYASYKDEVLAVGEDNQVTLRAGADSSESQDLLQGIRNDVERTRKDFEYFRRPATKASLLALLFVYARLNPGVRYVQGMNEVAAIILYVMSVDPECAEADAFWCFTEMMVEIKEGFMQALDHTGEGVYGIAEGVTQKLRSFDSELARHLQQSELSLFVFVLRWCTVLFAQDATLPDILRLWDSFIADPCRFEFVIHVCLAVLLGRRDDLLETEKQFTLAEIIQSAPRNADFERLLRRANAICAFERRGEHLPVFPPKRLQVVEDLSEWAAAVAQEVGLEVSRNFQEKIAPVVLERAGQAQAAASEKAKALNAWLEETAPARQEAIDQAQSQISSLWGTVKSKLDCS
ncbi:unnamed protein product, partial [Polarella glacialis]